MSESTYTFVDNLGLVIYRFVLPDRDVREFDDLDEAIRFAAANAVYEVGVVFPDGDAPLDTAPAAGKLEHPETLA